MRRLARSCVPFLTILDLEPVVTWRLLSYDRMKERATSFQADVSSNQTFPNRRFGRTTRPQAKMELPTSGFVALDTRTTERDRRKAQRKQLNLSDSTSNSLSSRILASRVLGNLEAFVLNGRSARGGSSTGPIDRIDSMKNSRCIENPNSVSREGKEETRTAAREDGKARDAKLAKGRKEARSFPLSCSARRHVRAWLAGARRSGVCVAALHVLEHAYVYEPARSIYVWRRVGTAARVCLLRGERVHARVRPRRTCTFARTHAWPRSRVCLCGDPNEGRQASKLGRAAAARAAILLESGWKTSPRSTRSSVTRLDVVRGFPRRWPVHRTGRRDSCHTVTCVTAEDRRACAASARSSCGGGRTGRSYRQFY